LYLVVVLTLPPVMVISEFADVTVRLAEESFDPDPVPPESGSHPGSP
jgi:hypothetical protein